MDIKKAKLDDDSFIYAKRENKSTKQKWSEMNRKEKWTFFKDYYLMKIILGAVVLGLIIKFGWDTFGPKPEEVLNVAFDSYLYLQDDFTAMQHEFLDYMELNEEEYTIRLDANYDLTNDPNSVQRFSLYVMTGDVDAFIAPDATFKSHVERGVMIPLTEVLPADLLESVSDRLVRGQIIETEIDGTITKIYDEEVYGINLDNIPLFSKYTLRTDKPIFGIVRSGTSQENAIAFLRFLLENYAE